MQRSLLRNSNVLRKTLQNLPLYDFHTPIPKVWQILRLLIKHKPPIYEICPGCTMDDNLRL